MCPSELWKQTQRAWVNRLLDTVGSYWKHITQVAAWLLHVWVLGHFQNHISLLQTAPCRWLDGYSICPRHMKWLSLYVVLTLSLSLISQVFSSDFKTMIWKVMQMCLLLTLTVEYALYHLLQPHHVDELAVGCRGQEVEEWGGGFGWGDL